MRKKLKVTRKQNMSQRYNLDGIPSSNMKMRYFKQKRTQGRIKNTIFQVRSWIKFFSIIFILYFCSRLMVCKYWYLPDNVFYTYPNKHLHIIGNKITPDDKILNALRNYPIPDKPIYLISTLPYEKEIEKLSPVKKAFVRRYWLPARFEVTVEEQIPVLTIAPNPKAPDTAAITQSGDVISREYLPIDTKKYKTYRILTYDDYKNWNKHEIQSLEILAQRIEDFSGEKLIYIDIRNKNDVYARLESTKIRIGELNSTLKERIERLSSVMPQIENLKRQTAYIDIRWDNTTYLKKKSKDYVEEELYKPEPRNIHQPVMKQVNIKAEPKTEPKQVESTSKKVEQKVAPKPVEKTKQKITPTTEKSAPIKSEKPINTMKQTPPAPKHVVPKKSIEDVPPIDIKVIEP